MAQIASFVFVITARLWEGSWGIRCIHNDQVVARVVSSDVRQQFPTFIKVFIKTIIFAYKR